MLQTDPTQWVNQKSQVIKNLNVLDREVHSSSELGVYVQSTNVFDQPTVTFVDTFTRTQLEAVPRHAAHRVGARQHRERAERRARRAHLTPTAAERAQPRTTSRRTTSSSRRCRRAATAMNIVFRTGPSGLDARAKVVARHPRDRATLRQAYARHRRASRSSGSACSTTSTRTGSCSPTSRSCSCSCSSRSGCAASSARCCRSFRC